MSCSSAQAKWIRRVLSIAVVISTESSSHRASAEESDGERLFREGRALMLKGEFAEACPKIEESHRREPHVGTLLNLAMCHQYLGSVGTAWAELEKALGAARAEGQTDRALFAEKQIAALEPRVPWITLTVSLPAFAAEANEFLVFLDGAPILPRAWNREMPGNPGPHIVTATSAGRTVFEEHFGLLEAERKTIAIAAPEMAAKAPESEAATVVLDASAPTAAQAARAARVEPLRDEPKRYRRWWVGISASVDFTFLPSAADACKLDVFTAQPVSGYYCVDTAGQDYPSRLTSMGNDRIFPSSAGLDFISGGPTVGNVRVLLSADYALNANFLLGVRAGYVAHTYPGQAAFNEGKAFAPINAEARATYVFGHDGIAAPGFAPMVLAAVGVAAFDGAATVDVLEINNSRTPTTRRATAYAVSGPVYGAIGGGLRFAPPENTAFSFTPKFVIAGGNGISLPIVQPEIGFQIGY